MMPPRLRVLNADIERTSLLQDEALLSSHLFGTNTSPLPEELKGVNLDIALQECYERMDLIGRQISSSVGRSIDMTLSICRGCDG